MADATAEAALAYARAGLTVLPLHWPAAGGCSCALPGFHPDSSCWDPEKGTYRSLGKHPAVPRGKDDATADLDVVERWWRRWPDANIGVRPPQGIAVLDVDPRSGGATALKKLTDQHGTLPRTLTCRTGSGGLHIWLAYAGPSRGRLAIGVDIKTSTGYLVVPPSLHASGRRYEWLVRGATAPAPQWIRDRLNPPKPRTGDWAPRGDGDTLDGLARWLAEQTEGNRNSALFWAACKAIQSGHHDLTPLAQAAEHNGLDRREIEATIASAQRKTAGATA